MCRQRDTDNSGTINVVDLKGNTEIQALQYSYLVTQKLLNGILHAAAGI